MHTEKSGAKPQLVWLEIDYSDRSELETNNQSDINQIDRLT